MLTNIVDRRTNPHRWREVTAVVEPTAQDNSVRGADEADRPIFQDWSYDELPRTSLAGAVAFATNKPGPTTLYLYDPGDGIVAASSKNQKKLPLRWFLAVWFAISLPLTFLWGAWFQAFPSGVEGLPPLSAALGTAWFALGMTGGLMLFVGLAIVLVTLIHLNSRDMWSRS